MKIGVCSMEADYYEFFKSVGFDYAEARLFDFDLMSDEEFNEYLRKVEKAKMPVIATNCFFKGFDSIVSPSLDIKRLEDYANKVFSRVQKLGVKKSVLGSGKIRSCLEGENFNDYYNRFVNNFSFLASIAKKYDIALLIEPLCRAETNMINTKKEGLKLIEDSKNDNAYLLADFYHIYCSGEGGVEALINSGEKLKHVHLARAKEDSGFPHDEQDKMQCEIWADILKKANYNDTISLECREIAGDYKENVKIAYEIMQALRQNKNPRLI